MGIESKPNAARGSGCTRSPPVRFFAARTFAEPHSQHKTGHHRQCGRLYGGRQGGARGKARDDGQWHGRRRDCGRVSQGWHTPRPLLADYVFDGVKQMPYTEEDAPNPINVYGRSKLAGDTAVRQAGGAYVILRTSWVYAGRRHNFLGTILRLASEREELRIVDDQIGAPTWARNIADATVLIVRVVCQEQAHGQFAFGLFNLTASGATSWHGFAKAILEDATRYALLPVQHLPQLKPIPSEEYPLPAVRPKNSRLAGDRISMRFGIALPDWKQGLALCIEEMKMAEQCPPPTKRS